MYGVLSKMLSRFRDEVSSLRNIYNSFLSSESNNPTLISQELKFPLFIWFWYKFRWQWYWWICIQKDYWVRRPKVREKEKKKLNPNWNFREDNKNFMDLYQQISEHRQATIDKIDKKNWTKNLRFRRKRWPLENGRKIIKFLTKILAKLVILITVLMLQLNKDGLCSKDYKSNNTSTTYCVWWLFYQSWWRWSWFLLRYFSVCIFYLVVLDQMLY